MPRGSIAHLVLFVMLVMATGGQAQDKNFQLLVTGGSRGQVLQSNRFGGDCDDEDIAEGKCKGGYERRATWVDTNRAQQSASFLIDMGEVVGFKGFWRLFEGKAHQALYNALGYDVVSIAKSDLFKGPATFKNFIDGGSYQVINTNIDWSVTALADLPRFAIVSRGGVTLAFTSLFDPIRMRQTNMGGATARNTYSSLAAVIGEIKGRGGVDAVVVMASLMTAAELEDIANTVENIDILIGNYEGSDRVVGRTSIISCNDCESGGTHVLKINGRISGGRVVSASKSITELDSSIASKASVQALVKTYYDKVIEDEQSNILGITTEKLIGDRSVCRFGTCNFGNLQADVLRAHTGADVAWVNSGGIRANIEAGQVTLGSILTAMPFSDATSTFALAGADIVKAFEWSIGGIASGKTTGRFLQISGAEFDWHTNTSVVSKVRVRAPNGTMIDIDMLGTYRCATTSFIRTGGDGFDVLETRAQDTNDNGPFLKELVADYFIQNSPVTAPTDQRHFETEDSRSLLTQCRAGYESDPDFGCIPCAQGRARAGDSIDPTCYDCLDGFYASERGQAQCTPCGLNMRTYIAGAKNQTQCQCEKGFYGDHTGCFACPVGGACPGGTSYVNVAPGFVRSDRDALHFRSCIPKEACLGGFNTTCAEGYSGENCGECSVTPSDRYFRRTGKCIRCRNPDSVFLVISFFLVLIIAVAVLILSLLFTTDTSRRRRGLIGILALVMQTFALFPFFFPETWPDDLDVLYNLISLFNLNIDLFAFECTFQVGAMGKWAMALMIPVLFVAVQGVALGIYHVYLGMQTRQNKITEEERRTKFDRMIDSCIGAFFVFLVFGYTFFSTVALSVFDCTRESDGTSFLAAAPSVRCYTASWAGLAVAGFLFTMLYPIGVPLILYKILNPKKTNHDSPRFQARFRIFVDEYHHHRWYWLVVLLVWRLALITVKTFIPVSWNLRGAAGVLIVFALLYIKVSGRARVDPVVALADLYSTMGLLLVFYLGLILHTATLTSAEDTFVVIVFYAVVIAVSLTTISLTLYALFGYKVWQKIKGKPVEKGGFGESSITEAHRQATRKSSTAVFQRRESVASDPAPKRAVLPYYHGEAKDHAALGDHIDRQMQKGNEAESSRSGSSRELASGDRELLPGQPTLQTDTEMTDLGAQP
eukprot:TRINITY_DN5095_c0_g1_i1.p1 TRINITY_DN5095_c0_g1~~TRINITY_DN5095_c0_g1_i1.p1  ORF type:complete len:1164 (-),score=236.20 TRINITY_DN5095_c0_g1_i1:101-3592(-)